MNFDMILKWLYIGVVFNPIGSAIFVWQHQILVNHHRCTQPSIGPLREVVTSCPLIFRRIPWQPCMIELAIDHLRRNAPLSVALSGISFFDRNLCCYDIPISNLCQTQIWPLGHITVPPKCNTKHANWTPLIRSYQKHANFGSTSILLWLSPQTSKWLKCRWRYIALMYGISSNHHRLILLRWFTRRHHLHGWQC